jgi:PD-(D/E)XK nuclease superfamily
VPLTLVTGPANAGKARVVMDALRAHHARGEQPLLVVPTRADVERYHGELARGGLVEGVRVERFQGLLAEVLRRAAARGPAGTQRPLGRLALERVLVAAWERARSGGPPARAGGVAAEGAAALQRAPGGPRTQGTRSNPVHATPGVVRALAALVGELEVARVSPVRLREALAAWAAADPAHALRARELAELYAEYRRASEELGRAGPERRAALALDALRRAPAAWGATPVLLYGFDDLGALQLDTVETLGVKVDAPVTVSLAYEPGRVAFAGRGDTFQRLRPLAAVHHQVGPRADYYTPAVLAETGTDWGDTRSAEAGGRSPLASIPVSASVPKSASAEGACPPASVALHHLERCLFEPGAPAVPAAGAVRLLEGGGERAELELVAEEIQGLLERGVPAGEIAVAHRAPGSVVELLGEVFRAHGVPFALERRVPFAHTALGRALVGLLAAAFPAGEFPAGEDTGAGDLLAWLRAPGVLARPELADDLERRVRRVGASTAAQARALWEADHRPLETLDRLALAAQRGPAALVARVSEELERLASAPRHRAEEALAPAGEVLLPGQETLFPVGSVLSSAEEALAPGQESLAPGGEALSPVERSEARALEAGRAALEELRELAHPAAELAPDAHGLIAILRGLEVVVGEEAHLGTPAVAVLDPLALRARRVRALFVCGLQEGVFPAPARPEPFLSEEERRGLAEASGLRLGRVVDALAAERYLLYAAVSRPEELLVLSWHTADDDGVPSARSLFVDDVCDLFACDLHAGRGDAGRFGDVSEASVSLLGRRRVSPGFGRTRRALGEVGRGSGVARPGAVPAGPSVEEQPGSGRCELSAASAGGPPQNGGQPDGRSPVAAPVSSRGGIAPLSDPRVLAELRERRLWSASGLQAWAGCPVRWFVERLLYAEDLEPDAEPLARGGLAHAALRDVLEGLRRETGSARLTPERVPRARELLHAALERHAGERPLSTAPERVPGVRRRLEADLERYLAHAAGERSEAGHQESPPEPTHFELPFGFPQEPGGLPALDLGEGVEVRGRVDRVDLAPGGEAVVYDYKGTLAPPLDRWVAERSFQAALYMRAVEALPDVRAVGGFYQPLSGRDLRARGVLAQGEGVELECVRGDAREPTEVHELVEEVLGAARAAAVQARAGELEARPQTCGFGGSGCVYPQICRCER